jgi:hypothetical protein
MWPGQAMERTATAVDKDGGMDHEVKTKLLSAAVDDLILVRPKTG